GAGGNGHVGVGRVAGAASAIAGWARKYPLAPRWRREQLLSLRTIDGVPISAARLEGPADAPLAVVFVHGFLNSSRSPAVHAFVHLLASRLHVIAPDLRGHGRSGGRVTLGALEPLDVDAAVGAAGAAWPGLPVVTVGTSLGGVAALRHAGLLGGVAGTVAISAPAWYDAETRDGARRLNRLVTSRTGRQVAARLLRTRVGVLPPVDDMASAVGAIAPAFTIVVHDPDEDYFGVEHARAIYEAARQPKDLWLVPGGHGSDLLTPDLAGRVVAEVIARASVQ
ncbi:MAG: alpha/beta fold hydrolase, partial [Acidimicrobiia bacterium]|nr:alpha/beta fold hydrolase [Acidimicrobiia bacterium]